MDADSTHDKDVDGDDEEYVLLDLGGVGTQVDLSPNLPYVLSGLDTANPVLTVGDQVTLIGEYEETIGTCYIFSESETSMTNQEGGTSERSLSVHPTKETGKQIKPLCKLHKVLKFQLQTDSNLKASTDAK